MSIHAVAAYRALSVVHTVRVVRHSDSFSAIKERQPVLGRHGAASTVAQPLTVARVVGVLTVVANRTV